jgi:squalene cyclase
MRLLGLVWSGAERAAVRRAASHLQTLQRADGGWGGNPGLASDAFSTGQALYALRESRVLAASAAAHRHGVRYLQTRQAADGSWHVASRAVAFQPYFESGFPYGRDQWISAAATAWASTALAAEVGAVRAAARSSR